VLNGFFAASPELLMQREKRDTAGISIVSNEIFPKSRVLRARGMLAYISRTRGLAPVVQ
jgi:hypothetical protein